MTKTFYIETWGCQMNDLDSQRLSGSLKLRGYRRVDDERQAALILLNTCSIREKAENKVYSRLGELRAEGRARRADRRLRMCGATGRGAHPLPRALGRFRDGAGKRRVSR